MKTGLWAAAAAMALGTPLSAGGAGYDMRLERAVNLSGAEVPEMVVAIHQGTRRIDRQALQGAMKTRLARAGVRADAIELQSVATAAIEFAEVQDRGLHTICYETWCSRVFVEGNGW